MSTIIAFLFVFTIVVLVHEFGHYSAAARLGVKVYEFSIGFPLSPRIATLFRRGTTEFTIRLLPLGGFVSFSRDGEDSPEYLSTARWKRFIIASAGSVFNILFAFVLIALAYVIENQAWSGVAAYSAASVGAAFTGTFKLLAALVTGSGSMDSLSGPVGIAVIAGKAAGAGLPSLLHFTGMLSLSLGILNLLPLPALDGGAIVILAVESVRRKTLGPNAYGIIGAAGVVFLLLLTAVVSYGDIMKLLA